MLFVPRGHAAAIGRAGQGKSWLLRRWCRAVDAAVLVDPTWDESAHAALPVGVVVRTVREVGLQLRDSPGGRCHVTLWPDANDLAGVLDQLCGLAVAYRDCAVAADEASVWLDPRRPLPPAVAGVMRRGRHDGVRLWTAAHRPADLPRLVTANGDVAVFRVTEPADLAYLRGLIGREAADRLPELPPWVPLVTLADGTVAQLDASGQVAEQLQLAEPVQLDTPAEPPTTEPRPDSDRGQVLDQAEAGG